MTLNELVSSVSTLKGWKTVTEGGAAGLAVPQRDGRMQTVALTQFNAEGAAMVRFVTRIGPADRLDAARLRSALQLNLRLPYGCLAVDGDVLVMTETRPLRTTTPETAGDALAFLARQADQYEELIFRTDSH